jgi:hypothetical protein
LHCTGVGGRARAASPTQLSLEAIIRQNATASWIRYDAFKWSGAAFHRHFLTQAAEQLGVSLDTDALYGEKSTNVLNFSLKDLGRTLASSLGFVVVMVGLLAGLFWVGHLVADHFDSVAAQRLVESVLVPVTLLAAVTLMLRTLLSASMDTLKVTRTVSAPSSDEQFEHQFRPDH